MNQNVNGNNQFTKVLRLKARFVNSLLGYEQNFQSFYRVAKIIKFTKLLIRNLHRKVYDKGLESTLSFFILQFWICKRRKAAEAVL